MKIYLASMMCENLDHLQDAYPGAQISHGPMYSNDHSAYVALVIIDLSHDAANHLMNTIIGDGYVILEDYE